MRPRYMKVIRDLTSDYSKNLMLVLAIAIGVFGIGSILGGYAVISREMTSNYMNTEPASATIEIDGNISPPLLDNVRTFPGIKKAERRATIVGRMRVNERWHPILFFVIDDFEKMEISKFSYISGSRIPTNGTMLVERTALVVMGANEGDVITVRTPEGTQQTLKISGIVHDPALAPAWQEQAGYGYITMATLRALGENPRFDLLRIQVTENEHSRQDITQKAEELADWLKQGGAKIHEIQIPPPGKHPHQSQMEAVLSIFTVFSFMILLLGSILVATSMATLMVKQVRQIGVMKTIGGTSYQVSMMYFFMMLIVCVVALLVSIPLSRLAAFGFYTQIATLLNLEITDSSIPIRVPLIQIASGILVPMIAAAVPLIRGSKISVRAALDNYGVSTQKQNRWTAFLSSTNLFTDSYRLSLRNAFRQRTRLVLTLGLLAAGGAMFMTALNVSDAWEINLKRIYTQRLYDQEIRLTERHSPDSVFHLIKKIDGVKNVEGWDFASSSIVNEGKYEVTKTYPDKGHGSFTIQALPVPTQLLNPTVVEGRWLKTAGSNDVVLNQLARTSEMKIGDDVLLAIDGKPSRWQIIGFTEDVGSPATAYVSITAFAKISGSSNKVGMLRIAYSDRSQDSARNKSRQIDDILENINVRVSSSIPVWLLHNAVAAHMKVLVNSLLAMAILMAIVGTLGLTSTISMNVLERTREIGVMRAIGATPKTIKSVIIWEGVTIGVLSILIAFLVSIALSYFMGQFIGHISFKTPLTLTISLMAIVIWVVLIVVGSYFASVFPARRANRVTTREALVYE
ncbi:MAG: FtsX-like permease family protein [Cyclobacteriaceae bacterium]